MDLCDICRRSRTVDPERKNVGPLLYGMLKQPDVHVSGFNIESYSHSSDGGGGGEATPVGEASA